MWARRIHGSRIIMQNGPSKSSSTMRRHCGLFTWKNMPKLINNKWVFTDDELDEQIARGKELYKQETEGKPVATGFKFDPKTRILSIRANDGSRIDFPVSRIKELQHASDSDIGRAYITKEGDAIHWDELDAHYTVAGLAANIFGTKEWMQELAKMGGRKTSAAKAEAARMNGLKGGRPRITTEGRSSFPTQRAAVDYTQKAASSGSLSNGKKIPAAHKSSSSRKK